MVHVLRCSSPNIDAVKPLAPFTFPRMKPEERIFKHSD